jgi:hypothetical protein
MEREPSLKKRQERNNREVDPKRERLRELKEKGKGELLTMEEVEEVSHLEAQLEGLKEESKSTLKLLDLSSSNDSGIINEKLEMNDNEKSHLDLSFDGYGTRLPGKEKIARDTVENNKTLSERTHALVSEYYETYKKDRETAGGYRGLQWASLTIGFLSLVMALWGRSDPPKRNFNALASGNDELSSTEDGVSSTDVGAGSGEGLPPGPSEKDIEELMQSLVINKEVIASGKIPQDMLWKNLASVADSLDIEAQNTALMFIAEAAVDLQGGRDFFWLDISEAIERYEGLREAHKRSGKLSDVYLEARKLKYNGNEVPPFHVALLIQFALGQIKHDLNVHRN